VGRINVAILVYSFFYRPRWHCYGPKEHIDIRLGIEVVELLLNGWLDVELEVVEVDDSELFTVSLPYLMLV
jgi:hypothetical protein